MQTTLMQTTLKERTAERTISLIAAVPMGVTFAGFCQLTYRNKHKEHSVMMVVA
jgi:hypothetical protein